MITSQQDLTKLPNEIPISSTSLIRLFQKLASPTPRDRSQIPRKLILTHPNTRIFARQLSSPLIYTLK